MVDDNFYRKLEEKTRAVNEIVLSYLPKDADMSYQRPVLDAMRYAIEAGGKRLRPMLMQEVFLLMGGERQDSKAIEPFMAAIEYIHTYSLIHDDLPAMDNDDYRRGRLTTHKKFGEAMGILAGDALLNYAFETALTACESDVSAHSIRAFRLLSEKAGIFGMIGGQVVDVLHEKEGRQLEQDELHFIYRLKTGALLEASMMIGAIMAKASEEQLQIVNQIAHNIGLAFQIQDDILDVIGTAEELGKPIGSDERNGKETYVFFYGIEASQQKVEELTNEAVSLLAGLGSESQDSFVKDLLISLIHRTK